jgi:hypothetical protein
MAFTSFCKPDTWEVDRLIDAVSEHPTRGDQILLPKFQRTLVWSPKQRTEFVDSLKRGYPIGSLLLGKAGFRDGLNLYYLIDGLQRTTTLRDFIRRPSEFVDMSQLPDGVGVRICEALGVDPVRSTEVEERLCQWIQTLDGLEEMNSFSAYDMARHAIAVLGIEAQLDRQDSLVNLLKPVVQDIKDKANLSALRVPVILYDGDDSQLPTIFDRINSNGTQLSKYQVFAASWCQPEYSSLRIGNEDIVEAIRLKYVDMSKKVKVEGFDPNPESFKCGNFTVFEYVFGLGKYLTQKYETLFGRGPGARAGLEESIGFNLSTVCVGLKLADMGQLPEHLLAGPGLVEYEKCLLESVDWVQNVLRPYLSVQMNQKKANPRGRVLHSEYQIVSMVGKVFRSRFGENLETRSTWPSVSKLLSKTLPQYYLLDILRDQWRGSGDKKVAGLVEDGSDYEKVITKDEWNSVLEAWFAQQLKNGTTERSRVTDDTKLFLRYLYVHLLSINEDLSPEEYHLEHLVPVMRLTAYALHEGPIPISCVANLCLLDKSTNLSKGSLTLYEYFDDPQHVGRRKNVDHSPEAVKKIERLTIVNSQDLAFVGQLGRDSYMRFLRSRFDRMKDLFFGFYQVVS